MWSLDSLLVSLFALCLPCVYGSAGDRSLFFQRCMSFCQNANCTISDADFASTQPLALKLTKWSCADECSYTCMWKTVDAFRKDGSKIPQFYGKWPFVRLWGMQEPASVIFSVLNGLSYIVAMYFVRARVPSSAPLYHLWHIHGIVAVHTWFWSSVFHARDLPFTEKMDYFCAISLVVFSVFMLFARLWGTKAVAKLLAVFTALAAFFVYHVHYLAFVHFDYGYNMKAMVAVGLGNAIGWVGWCICVRKTQPYVWKCAFVIMSSISLLTLEVQDFSPFLWVFDAHSLWHAGTAPMALIWGSFLVDDCLYMDKQAKLKDKNKEGQKDKVS